MLEGNTPYETIKTLEISIPVAMDGSGGGDAISHPHIINPPPALPLRGSIRLGALTQFIHN